MINLYQHQIDVLNATKEYTRCAYYLDMGLGKTYIGSEKAMDMYEDKILIICQKSKIDDWIDHFRSNYDYIVACNLTKNKELNEFIEGDLNSGIFVGVINYELVWRRKDLLHLRDFTLMLDESSLISNEQAKRTKFILKLNAKNVILLSGTPVAGKYEQLWSQCRLLGWNIKKSDFYDKYIITKKIDVGGFKVPIVIGYKNVEELKNKLKQHGAVFMKTEEVITLPEQIEQTIFVEPTSEYRKFCKNGIVNINKKELVGDTILTQILYRRQLCSQYNQNKINAFKDILQSTNERLIVFYEFTAEYEMLSEIVKSMNKSISVVNGKIKDLNAYENKSDSVTFIQYRAGAYGLNLQKSTKIIYFTLPLGKGSCDLLEQSKKRIHRIGQNKTCFYYYLITKRSIEVQNKKLLERGIELTNELFNKNNF